MLPMSANPDHTTAAFNPERFGRLESDVEYLKRDVGEIKVDLRGLRAEMTAEFKSVRADIRADFLALLRLMIAGFAMVASLMIGLAGLMAHGFRWIG
jgi:hypothetical protein